MTDPVDVETLTMVIAMAAGGYGMIVAVMYVAQRRLMYVPSPHTVDPAAAGVPELADVRVRTADGLDLLAWHAGGRDGRPTILYLHGNAGTLAGRAEKVRPYLDAGYGVLLLAWRGYSGNDGRPHEAGLYADGRAALDFLAKVGAGSGDVVLYSESLGTGVAVHLAHEQAAVGAPVRAVALEAPFISMADAAQHHYPWLPARRLVRDRFDSLAKIAGVAAPTLILHGERDEVVPFGHARVLHERAPEPRRLLTFPHAGHADVDAQVLADAVISFVELHCD